jgi:hypothetical protein
MNAAQIVETWERIDADEPGISTEQLMARVCQECKCDAGDVVAALDRDAGSKQNER